MRSRRSLRTWCRHLLPTSGPSAQIAALRFLQALLVGFTTDRCQLARQLPRATSAKSRRQFLSRWLHRPQWAPEPRYARLMPELARWLAGLDPIPLLIDHTYLQCRWSVLQVAVPWQGRALPIYRLVCQRRHPHLDAASQLTAALAFLSAHLPGGLHRYVLVLDRGFPSNTLVRALTEGGFRFVMRVSGTWRMTHGGRADCLATWGSLLDKEENGGRLYEQASLGHREKGRKRWSETNVVIGPRRGEEERWYLLTTEPSVASAMSIYRQRVQIEGEFRDLKGPWGLDGLARWHDREEVACLLAWVAVYEWRLAYLWERHQLGHWRSRLQVKGRLSWIRITREWIRIQLVERAIRAAPACL